MDSLAYPLVQLIAFQINYRQTLQALNSANSITGLLLAGNRLKA